MTHTGAFLNCLELLSRTLPITHHLWQNGGQCTFNMSIPHADATIGMRIHTDRQQSVIKVSVSVQSANGTHDQSAAHNLAVWISHTIYDGAAIEENSDGAGYCVTQMVT